MNLNIQNLHEVNCKTWLKVEKHTMFLDRKTQHHKHASFPYVNLQI